jgi:hypothetical protein
MRPMSSAGNSSAIDLVPSARDHTCHRKKRNVARLVEFTARHVANVAHVLQTVNFAVRNIMRDQFVLNRLRGKLTTFKRLSEEEYSTMEECEASEKLLKDKPRMYMKRFIKAKYHDRTPTPRYWNPPIGMVEFSHASMQVVKRVLAGCFIGMVQRAMRYTSLNPRYNDDLALLGEWVYKAAVNHPPTYRRADGKQQVAAARAIQAAQEAAAQAMQAAQAIQAAQATQANADDDEFQAEQDPFYMPSLSPVFSPPLSPSRSLVSSPPAIHLHTHRRSSNQSPLRSRVRDQSHSPVRNRNDSPLRSPRCVIDLSADY